MEQNINVYLGEGLLDEGQAVEMYKIILAERGKTPVENDMGEGEDDAEAGRAPSGSRKLTPAQMEALVAKRIDLMKAGGVDGKDTDQFRVFQFITEVLQSDKKLRLMVQARRHRKKLPADHCVFVVSGPENENSRRCAHRFVA